MEEQFHNMGIGSDNAEVPACVKGHERQIDGPLEFGLPERWSVQEARHEKLNAVAHGVEDNVYGDDIMQHVLIKE
jgi:hypothetical protein